MCCVVLTYRSTVFLPPQSHSDFKIRLLADQISMPPKPQVFKTPDGKEFASKAEWRDYMVETFYSFKNKKNEPEPLIKTVQLLPSAH